VDFNYTHTNGYAETGAGIYNLSVLPTDDFQVSVAAGMEFGRSYDLNPGLSVRVYGYGGVRYTPDNTTTTQLLFSGVSSPVTQTSHHDRYLGEFSAGMKFFGQEGLGFDVRYDGAFGQSVTSQSIKGKLRWRF
jgi:outer membrane autotransporter protein